MGNIIPSDKGGLMITVDKPASLDGAKLIDELIAAGCTFTKEDADSHLGKAAPLVNDEGKLVLFVKPSDLAKAAAVVKAHTA
jgi:hypothetical protein